MVGWAAEAYMPSRAKEKGIGVLDFKGEKDNSQGDEKIECLVKKCLLGHTETMGHREKF